MDINSLLKQRILILDGSMGVMIQKSHVPESAFNVLSLPVNQQGNNDILNLSAPEYIRAIHRAYLDAGADIITTNTFNANALSQQQYGTEGLVREINLAGARIAREMVGDKALVAGSVGPTAHSLTLQEGVSFEQMQAAYLEQIKALKEGGVDLLLLETFYDGLNVRAALSAAAQIDLPVIVSLTLTQESGRLLTGQTIESILAQVLPYKPLAVGFNCSSGPENLRGALQTLASISPVPTILYPNAGMPDQEGNYELTPDLFCREMHLMASDGLLNIAGGCCGTQPEHIALLKRELKGLKPRELTRNDDLRQFCNVGERCNVAGSRKFLRLVNEDNWDEAVAIARKQVSDGAMMIDINMDDPMLDAGEKMVHFLKLLAQEPECMNVPCMIDSSDFQVISRALKHVQGKPVVNSLSLKQGEKVFLEQAAEYKRMGAAVVVMAFDEQGQATSLRRRTEICERAYRLLVNELDIAPENIIFDPNILTIATGIHEHDTYARDYIDAVAWIKKNLPGAKTSGGVSNLSFAFRGNDYLRKAMHSVFLYHAMKAGLDMAIVNPAGIVPYDDIPAELRAALEDLIFACGYDADRLITLAAAASGKEKTVEIVNAEPDDLKSLIISGKTENLEPLLMQEVNQAGSAAAVISGTLMQAMSIVGERFQQGRMFLPQVVKSARAMSKAVEILTPLMEKEETDVPSRGRFLIATVKGDVHDIGKNIAAVVLRCNGYEVIDLGIMVPAEKIVAEAKRLKPDFIGLSGLITPSLNEMCIVAQELHRAGINVPLMVSGAATSGKHTELKIRPLYPDGIVVRVADAAQNPVIAAKITAGEWKTENIEMSVEPMIKHETAPQTMKRQWPVPASPLREPIKVEIPVKELTDFINWRYFFNAWKVKPDSREAGELQNDAEKLLSELTQTTLQAQVAFFPAHAKGEEIIIDNQHISTARSLSSYVAAEDDYVGVFQVTIGSELREKVQAAKDDYERLLLMTLCDRLAEAGSEYLHRHVRRDLWGYSQDENLTLHDVLCQKYQGIRPAVGYPSIPDQSMIFALDTLLPFAGINIQLTENGAMNPASSICGLYIANPKAKY